jgi:hypothetical protein
VFLPDALENWFFSEEQEFFFLEFELQMEDDGEEDCMPKPVKKQQPSSTSLTPTQAQKEIAALDKMLSDGDILLEQYHALKNSILKS